MPEDRLRRPLVDGLAALLTSAFPAHADAYAGRAWKSTAPAFRVVAAAPDGHIAGQVSASRVAADASCALFGIGDLAVESAMRGRGVARRLCELVVAAAWDAGAEAQLVRTRTMAATFARLGFAAAPPFAFYTQDATVCATRADWLVARRLVLPATPIRLVVADF